MKSKTKKMTVRVTWKDIRSGVMGDCQMCPIAKALRRKTYYKQDINVAGSEDCTVGNYQATGPKTMDTFINQFDAGKPVKPFTLTLTLTPRQDYW